MSDSLEIRSPHNACGLPRGCDSIAHCNAEGACRFSGSPFVQPQQRAWAKEDAQTRIEAGETPRRRRTDNRAPIGSINGDLAEELHKRYAMGLEKYGVTLDANAATISARLQHMKEELMDALCYVEWALREMKGRGL